MNKHFFSIIFIFSFLLSLSFVSADCFFDKDCDGWWDINDNCPDNYNPFQEDINNNDIGDICEHQPVFSVQIQNLSWVWNTNKTMDLSQYFLDLDGDELTYFSNGLNQIIVSFKGNIATFTPPINWTGTEILTINATDGLTSVQSNAFSLLVFMPNMAPTVSIISPTNNQAFQTSSQINFVSKANDPNNDLLNYAWTFGDGTTAIGENATHAYATNGTFKVIVSVSDGEFSANDSVFVNVLNPKTNNSAPFWVFSVPDVSLFEDFGLFTHVLDLVSLVFDVDSDVLFFSVVSENPSEVRCDVSGSSLVLSSVLNWFGNSSCVVRVFDGSGAFSDSAFFIEIKPVNDLPTWSIPVPDVSLFEDFGLFTHVLDLVSLVFDVDSDVLFFSVVSEDTSMVDCFVISSRLLLFSEDNWFGNTSCVIRTTDETGDFSDSNFAIEVTSVNDIPVVLDIQNQTIFSGDSFTVFDLDDFVFDVETPDSNIEWTVSGNNSYNVSIDSNNFVHLSYPSTFIGFENLVFTAFDSNGASASDSMIATVLSNVSVSNNSAPFWVFSVPDVSLFEDFGLFTHVLDLVSLVFDVDSDVLFFSVVSENPSEVRCDVSGSSLVLSSVLNWFGNSSCVVRVFDGSGAFSDSAFFIEIKPVNDIPMFVFPFSDQNATVGITFTYDIDCYDVDNAIIYDDNTNLFNINPVSGMISFVPLNSTVGTYNIQINCSDVSTTISDSFKLIISTNTINNSVNNTNTTNNNTNTTNSSSSVLMNLTTIKTIYALQNFHYQINYSGLNHTTLFFSDDSSLFDVDSTTGIISFTPTISDIGIHESKILMRDGVLSKTETLILRILDYILPKCSDGLDNDDDGFIDMDDSGCSNPSDNQEFMIVDDIEDGLEFGKIRIFGFDFFMVERGDDLVVRAKIENTLNKKISGVSFGVLIPELGLKFKSNPFNIAARSDSSEELIIPIDECVVPGQYYVKVYVTNNKISKSEYYLIDVI